MRITKKSNDIYKRWTLIYRVLSADEDNLLWQLIQISKNQTKKEGFFEKQNKFEKF